MTTVEDRSENVADLALRAKGALERVCSGAGLDPASRYYSPAFRDHVNDLEFFGLEGTQRSIDLYKSALSGIAITVEDQLIEADRVTSRFVVTGTNRGRHVRFNGITISRFENGLVVEDWSVTDTLGMLRQLGVWRSFVLAISSWRSLGAMSSSREGDRAVVRAHDEDGSSGHPQRCRAARQHEVR